MQQTNQPLLCTFEQATVNGWQNATTQPLMTNYPTSSLGSTLADKEV